MSEMCLADCNIIKLDEAFFFYFTSSCVPFFVLFFWRGGWYNRRHCRLPLYYSWMEFYIRVIIDLRSTINGFTESVPPSNW